MEVMKINEWSDNICDTSRLLNQAGAILVTRPFIKNTDKMWIFRHLTYYLQEEFKIVMCLYKKPGMDICRF